MAGGTAPFVVTSTTQVANLNVETAGVAGYVTAAAQSNITSVGTLSGLTVTNPITGNITGSASSATTAGTVTTAAQPNITSVGTLTSLGVNGTVTAVSFTANTGVFTGSGSGLSAINASNISSGTLPAARLSGSYTININGSATSATTAGTVTTAAQPNITSVGTLSSLTTSGSIIRSGTLSGYLNGNYPSADSSTTSSPIYTIGGTYLPTSTTLGTMYGIGYAYSTVVGQSGVPNSQWGLYVASGGVSRVFLNSDNGIVYGTGGFQGPLLTTGANTTSGTITGNWTLSAGSKWNATYADLSEKYVADASYGPGTVLVFGGEHEVTISTEMNTTRVAGVVTTDAAYTMNSGLEAEFVADIALQGRVPCKVIGPVFKGDLLVAAGNGHAIANNEARAGTIIGKSLENFNEASGIIEVAVGRF